MARIVKGFGVPDGDAPLVIQQAKPAPAGSSQPLEQRVKQHMRPAPAAAPAYELNSENIGLLVDGAIHGLLASAIDKPGTGLTLDPGESGRDRARAHLERLAAERQAAENTGDDGVEPSDWMQAQLSAEYQALIDGGDDDDDLVIDDGEWVSDGDPSNPANWGQ